MNIGFIGAGNMGSAIMGGILKNEELSKTVDIMASDANAGLLETRKSELGINVTTDNKEVAAWADVLFIAVKPQFGEGVLKEIKDSIKTTTLVISIMAGKALSYLTGMLGADKKIIRTMPNTPALVLEAMTAICPGENVSDEDVNTALTLFNTFGKGEVVSENLMDAVTAVSGSSPAYVFMFIEAMADAAVKEGMPRDKAYKFASQAVYGSAKMALETGKHPGELKDMVCSPAGTTIDAVKALEDKGFRGIVMDAVNVCAEKSRSMK